MTVTSWRECDAGTPSGRHAPRIGVSQTIVRNLALPDVELIARSRNSGRPAPSTPAVHISGRATGRRAATGAVTRIAESRTGHAEDTDSNVSIANRRSMATRRW